MIGQALAGKPSGARTADLRAAAEECRRLGMRTPQRWDDADETSIEVYALHWDAFRVCNTAKPSWSIGPTRAVCTGFEAGELRIACDAHRIPLDGELLKQIRVIESAFIAAQRHE